MASDRKSKKKRSSSSSFEDEEKKKKKRHKSSEPKPDKKDKHSSHKSHKTHKEGMPEEKHKHKHKLHKHDRHEISNFKELSDADYFSKNNEFSTWLKDERDTFFSDLSSESARKLFAKFVKRWNNKKLDSKYYDGIVVGKRSSHNWKIKADAKGDPHRHIESNRDIKPKCQC